MNNTKYLQYTNVNGDTNYHPISSFFLNAIMPDHCVPDSKNKNKLCGLNVGVALPHDDSDACVSFYDDFSIAGEWDFYDVFVCDDSGMKMPVIIHGGNGFEEKMGTSCLFGYVCPEMFDDRPEMKYS